MIRLHGIYIGNFRCGPDSFIMHFVSEALKGKPTLQLEIDEHSADAGLITRLEAFLDSIRKKDVEVSTDMTGAFQTISSSQHPSGTGYYTGPICTMVLTLLQQLHAAAESNPIPCLCKPRKILILAENILHPKNAFP